MDGVCLKQPKLPSGRCHHAVELAQENKETTKPKVKRHDIGNVLWVLELQAHVMDIAFQKHEANCSKS